MIINSRQIYNGAIVDLVVDTVELPNGHVMDMEIIQHPGGSAIVAINSEKQLCLLKQYRHAIGDWLWEIPAGKIDNEESPEITAKRELLEEAGVSANRWISLGTFISSPGVFSEIVHLYLALDLDEKLCNNEPGEVFELHWIDIDKAVQWTIDSTINDGKTISAITRACHYINKNK